MTLSFLPKNAFPLPAPLTPTLVALGLDSKTAATVSKVYISTALSLKETFETEYIRACGVFVSTSDDHGHSSKELRSKLLTVATTRYMQALSRWIGGTIEKAEASLLRRGKSIPKPRTKIMAALSEPSRNGSLELLSEQETVPTTKPCQLNAISPPHAFPRAYPPPVRPEPISFVTHIPLLERGSRREPRDISDSDLGACIDALSRLSLGPPPPSQGPCKPPKTASKQRSRTHTSSPKHTSQLSPSRPRLVSPTLDTSVAVSHKPFPKCTSSSPSPNDTPRSRNIDIPRSNRRKVCSIPYQRPTIHPSSPPESPSSPSFPHNIRRTPSLISDHGSEAGSPSTPPDFPSIPIPTTSLPRKSSFPEAMSSFEYFPANYSGGHSVDFGTNIYG